MRRIRTRAAALLLAAVAISGCAIGAARIEEDRLEFGTALTQSWKEQFLLNVVRSRYLDPPTILDVTSIINQHAVTGEGAFGVGGIDAAHLDAALGSVSGLSRYEVRPTVSYLPVRGEQYVRILLTPVRPSLVLSLIEAGWPAEPLLRICVKSMNGLRNRDGSNPDARPGDPDFDAVVETMAAIQRTGKFGMRVARGKDKDDVALALDATPGKAARGVRDMLGIGPDVTELRIVFAPKAQSNDELAMLTRSVGEVMQEFASGVEVSENDVSEGRASRVLPADARTPFHVRRGDSRPNDAFVAVRYRNAWFWVEDTDLASKRSLNIALLIQSLQESSGGGAAPVVTVSTN